MGRPLVLVSVAVLAWPFADILFSQAVRHPPRAPRPVGHGRVALTATGASEVATASELIDITKGFVDSRSGFYSPADPSILAEDFVFRGPYIGPLNKADYLLTMDTFKIYEGLPDIRANAFGFSIDPQDANRVWFLVRNTGTFTGEIGLPFGLSVPPNGAELRGCTETFSVLFNEQKQVKMLTVGYVADRFEGNTRGKGAAVGIFNVIGLPFPEPGPGLEFAQWFGTEILNSSARSYTLKEDVPKWWTNEDKGAVGYS